MGAVRYRAALCQPRHHADDGTACLLWRESRVERDSLELLDRQHVSGVAYEDGPVAHVADDELRLGRALKGSDGDAVGHRAPARRAEAEFAHQVCAARVAQE